MPRSVNLHHAISIDYKTVNPMKRLLLISTLVLLISACATYKPVIQQGNALEQTTVSRVKVGMSKSQVIRTLGSPLMQDDFRANRWDYLYYSTERGVKSAQKNLILTFSNGVVSKIN